MLTITDCPCGASYRFDDRRLRLADWVQLLRGRGDPRVTELRPCDADWHDDHDQGRR